MSRYAVFEVVTWGGQRSEHLQILLSMQQLQHTHTHRSHTHTLRSTCDWQVMYVYPGEVDVEAWDAAEACHGALSRNHSKRRKTAEVLVAFVEELEVVRLSAGHPHSQSVQNTVHVCVREAHLRQRLSHSQRLTNTTTPYTRAIQKLDTTDQYTALNAFP